MTDDISPATELPAPGFLLAEGGILTEDEMAAGLKKSLPTVRRWRKAGVGPPYIMIGREIHHSKPAVLDWLANGGMTAAEKLITRYRRKK